MLFNSSTYYAGYDTKTARIYSRKSKKSAFAEKFDICEH